MSHCLRGPYLDGSPCTPSRGRAVRTRSRPSRNAMHPRAAPHPSMLAVNVPRHALHRSAGAARPRRAARPGRSRAARAASPTAAPARSRTRTVVVPAFASLRVSTPAKRFFLPATRTDNRTVAGALIVTRAPRPRRRSDARRGRERVLTRERQLRLQPARRPAAPAARARRSSAAPTRPAGQDLLADRAAVVQRAQRRGVDAVALGPGDPAAVGREGRARERVGVRRLERQLAAEGRRRARAGGGEQAQDDARRQPFVVRGVVLQHRDPRPVARGDGAETGRPVSRRRR